MNPVSDLHPLVRGYIISSPSSKRAAFAINTSDSTATIEVYRKSYGSSGPPLVRFCDLDFASRHHPLVKWSFQGGTDLYVIHPLEIQGTNRIFLIRHFLDCDTRQDIAVDATKEMATIRSITPAPGGFYMYGDLVDGNTYFAEYVDGNFNLTKSPHHGLGHHVDETKWMYDHNTQLGCLVTSGDKIQVWSRTSTRTSSQKVSQYESALQVYPNPVTDFVTFRNLERDATITVYDVPGRQDLTATDNRVDMSNLSTGLYLWTATSDVERVSGKLVKK